MAESLTVTLLHPKEVITVPETILRACSPVLDVILRDTALPQFGGSKILTIDDVRIEQLRAFVDMISMHSYAPTWHYLPCDDINNHLELPTSGLPTTRDLAVAASLIIPLVHKYDCKGLCMRLQAAVNEQPYTGRPLSPCSHTLKNQSGWRQRQSNVLRGTCSALQS